MKSNKHAQTIARCEVEFNNEDKGGDEEEEDGKFNDETDASVESSDLGPDKQDGSGWKIIPRGRSSSPRNSPPVIHPICRCQEEPDNDGLETLAVVSVILPPSRQPPYEKDGIG